MTRVDRISATVILLFALLASFGSIRLGLWEGEIPGSGLFPLAAAGGMALLAGLLLVTSRAAAPEEADSFLPRGEALKQLGVLALALVVYPSLVQFLGFLFGSVVFLAFLFRYPGGYGWGTSLVVSVLTVGILYAGLVVLLGVDLPRGPVGL